MFNIERWQEIFETISKNKLRTALTGLSVSSGIFILIILLGVAEGLRKGTKKQFEKDIPTKLYFGGRFTGKEYKGLNPNRKIRLNLEDYQNINKQFEDDLQYRTANIKRYGAQTSYKDKNGVYILFGVMPDHMQLENAYLIAGRFLSEKDLETRAKVVVLGTRIIADIFGGDHKKAIGKFLTINEIKYTVIGVTEDNGGEREDTYMFTPHSTMTHLYNSPNNAGSFQFTVNPEEDYDIALAKADKFGELVVDNLKKAHNIHPEDDKAINFFNALEGGKDIYMVNVGMKIFFWGIGILTLLSGIVGVSNIMIIIVKERTKEIGIRKALGAQPKSIVSMILHESIFITTLFGFIGLFLALGILEFLGPKIETDFIISPTVDFNVAISTVIMLVFAGAFAGYLPARRASKIKPIIALRDE